MGLYIVDDDLIEFINESIIIERLTDKNASKKIDFETDIEAITKELSPNGEKVMLLPTSSNKKNYVK
jgi:hypothetical protein